MKVSVIVYGYLLYLSQKFRKNYPYRQICLGYKIVAKKQIKCQILRVLPPKNCSQGIVLEKLGLSAVGTLKEYSNVSLSSDLLQVPNPIPTDSTNFFFQIVLIASNF